MEWLTGLALLPVLASGAMMGGMALAGVLGWRRTQGASVGAADTDGAATKTPEDARR